jgi:hypothetical protein
MIDRLIQVDPLTRQFLVWVAERPRSYSETMAAWRTSCPRLAIWEDALAAGLVEVETGSGVPLSQSPVRLTPRGDAARETSGDTCSG